MYTRVRDVMWKACFDGTNRLGAGSLGGNKRVARRSKLSGANFHTLRNQPPQTASACFPPIADTHHTCRVTTHRCFCSSWFALWIISRSRLLYEGGGVLFTVHVLYSVRFFMVRCLDGSGATGGVGRRVVEELRRQGVPVRGMVSRFVVFDSHGAPSLAGLAGLS